jgi:hypothetical protein
MQASVSPRALFGMLAVTERHGEEKSATIVPAV